MKVVNISNVNSRFDYRVYHNADYGDNCIEIIDPVYYYIGGYFRMKIEHVELSQYE